MNQIKVMGIRKTHKWHAAMCKIQGQVKIALNMLNQLYAPVVKLVNTRGLSPRDFGSCGFESRRAH